VCLWSPGLSLAGVLISANRTDPVSLCRLGLPRLKLSRSVRFPNRFTEQGVDLQFPYPYRPSAGAIPGTSHHVRLARQRHLRSCPALSRGALAVTTAVNPAQGTDRAVALPRPLPRTRLLPDLTADGFCPGSAQPITQ